MNPTPVGDDFEIALPRHMSPFNMQGKRVIFKRQNHDGIEEFVYKHPFNPKDIDGLAPTLFQLMYASIVSLRKVFYTFWVRNEICRAYMDVRKFNMSLKDPESGEWVVKVSRSFPSVSHEDLEGWINECTDYQPDKTKVYIRLITTRDKIRAPEPESDDYDDSSNDGSGVSGGDNRQN